jgi:hypothetical protein
MSLYAGTATGRLSAPVRMSSADFGAVRLLAGVGDVTGDGYPDLMGQPSGSSMRIYPSNGRNGFRASYVAHAAVPGSQQLGIGLWNGDGAPDSLLRAADGTLTVWSGNGPGGLTGAATGAGSLPGYSWVLAQGDLDGDRRPDLVAKGGAGRLWLFPGASSGFGERRSLADGMSRFDLAG